MNEIENKKYDYATLNNKVRDGSYRESEMLLSELYKDNTFSDDEKAYYNSFIQKMRRDSNGRTIDEKIIGISSTLETLGIFTLKQHIRLAKHEKEEKKLEEKFNDKSEEYDIKLNEYKSKNYIAKIFSNKENFRLTIILIILIFVSYDKLALLFSFLSSQF